MPVPIPHLVARDFADIRPEDFLCRGVRVVLLDLDNTLAPYSLHHAAAALCVWIEGLKQAGLTPFLLSNNRGDRPAVFAKALDIGYVRHARKPRTAALFRVLEQLGAAPQEAALVGDQIYTDVLCARRAGILAVLVRPIALENPLLALRYFAEFPFRLAARGRAEQLSGRTAPRSDPGH